MLENKKFYFQEPEEFIRFLENHEWEQMQVPKSEFSLALDAGGNLVVSLWGKEYPMRETCKQSLLSRYNINGKTLYKCLDSELHGVLKILEEYFPQEVSVMICSGIVNGVNSKNYSHIPLQEIFEETLQVVSPFYDGEVRCTVDYDYSKCRVFFKTDRSFSFLERENNLIITLVDSECGDSTVRFGAYIGNDMAPIMDDITIVHTGNADIEQVKGEISGLEAVVSKNFQAVKSLENIKVSAPISAIKELGKDAGIPEKYRNDVIDIINSYEKKKITAADIYMTFAKIIKEADVSEECKEKHRNNLLKLVTADWSKFGKEVETLIPTMQKSKQQLNAVASLLTLF